MTTTPDPDEHLAPKYCGERTFLTLKDDYCGNNLAKFTSVPERVNELRDLAGICVNTLVL